MSTSSWEITRAEARDRWASVQTSSSRLQVILDLILDYRDHSRNLQPMLNPILALLEASQSMHQIDELALKVLVALDHWVTALNLWPRWETLLRHYVSVAHNRNQPEIELILMIYLCEIVHQIGRATEGLEIASEGFRRANESISPQTTGRLLIKVVWSALMLNDQPRALRALERANALYEAYSGAEQAVFLAYLRCAGADYVRRSGSVAEAVRLSRESIHLFEQDPDAHVSTQATAYRICGVYEWAFGDHHSALKTFQQAARLYRVLGDQFGLAWVFGNQALAYRFLGQLQKAEMMTQRGIEISKQYGAQWQITFETGNLVDIYLAAGQLDQARRVVKRHWDLAHTLDIQGEMVRARSNMALINIQRGRYRAALRPLWAHYHYSKTEGRFESLAIICCALSQCYDKLRRPWRAKTLACAALTISRRIQSNRLQIMALRAQAECLPAKAAQESLEQALSLTDEGSYEQTACEVSLLPYIENEKERHKRWIVLHDRLVEMGMGAYLFDCDENHLPHLVLCI